MLCKQGCRTCASKSARDRLCWLCSAARQLARKLADEKQAAVEAARKAADSSLDEQEVQEYGLLVAGVSCCGCGIHAYLPSATACGLHGVN